MTRKFLDEAVQALNHSSSEVRMQAAQMLGDIGDRQAVALLISLLNDDSLAVWFTVMEALTKVADTRTAVVGPILYAAGRRWRDVGQGEEVDAVMDALRELLRAVGREDSSPLLEILQNPDMQDRWVIVEVLGELRDPRALNTLITLLEEPELALYAASALGQIADMRALGPIVMLIRSGKVLPLSLADALAALGESAVQPLIFLLNDADPRVAHAAAGALRKLATPEAQSALQNWEPHRLD